MTPRVPEEQLDFARALRLRMTAAETMLWRTLRHRGIGAKFRRQMPVGPYVADFACVSARLIVELDGRPHDAPEQRFHDQGRDAFLIGEGWRIVRFSNDDVVGGGNIVPDRIKALISSFPSSDPR